MPYTEESMEGNHQEKPQSNPQDETPKFFHSLLQKNRIVDHSKGTGVTNTGLVYFNNRLLAMSEDDFPYHVKVTPTSDLITKERFSKDGKKSNDVEIPVEDPIMMHYFTITEKFIIIPDQQVVFKISKMIRGGSSVVYDKENVSRFGVMEKYGKDNLGLK
ncbi:hypothetical protein BC332_07885 [Capsicum chinense]|nr:hypothetical protein BC332_07885 [Capsicum chinense]